MSRRMFPSAFSRLTLCVIFVVYMTQMARSGPDGNGPSNYSATNERVVGTQTGPADVPPGYILIEGDIQVRQEEDGICAAYVVNLWSDGIIPFEFGSDVTMEHQDAMLGAMAAWEAVATVNFAPHTDQANYVLIHSSVGN